MKIPFNRPPKTSDSATYLTEVLACNTISGDGVFTAKCTQWLQNQEGAEHALLTTSGSHALEMAAYLTGISYGDEVIMPSYTFSSTANAFVGRGAKVVFVDIRPDTMNLDEALVEDAITDKTKVIVPVHYAGVACEMDAINDIAKRHNLFVVEDAAQALMATYKGKPLGALSDFGCFSFHETKNFSMGEGGALILHNDDSYEKAEILREKGTNRSKFFRGQIDKYSWMEWGSSYLPSDILAAYLWSQLEVADDITDNRLRTWNLYSELLRDVIETAYIPENCKHNAHMFWIKVKNLEERTKLIAYLREQGVTASYHYVPLHSAPAGLKYGRFHGNDIYTTHESERLLRLPMYYGLTENEVVYVAEKVKEFFI